MPIQINNVDPRAFPECGRDARFSSAAGPNYKYALRSEFIVHLVEGNCVAARRGKEDAGLLKAI